MDAMGLNQILEQMGIASIPITEIIGDRLPRRLYKIADPEMYDAVRQCPPFGDRPVREVAAELNLRPERLWRWLHRTRLRLELSLLDAQPFRVGYLIEHGQQLRETSCKLDHAEDYLKAVRRKIPKLKLPENVRTWFVGECSRELGYVYRDRGGRLKRKYSFECFAESRNAFSQLERQLTRQWADQDITASRIVAEQRLLEMNKIEAVYRSGASRTLLRRSWIGYEKLIDELQTAPKSVNRFQVCLAESWRLCGEMMARSGAAAEGVKRLNDACSHENGSLGDQIGRLIRRAEANLMLERFDECYCDLEVATKLSIDVKFERSLYEQLIGKGFCQYEIAVGDISAFRQRAKKLLASARRLGLKDQMQKIELLTNQI